MDDLKAVRYNSKEEALAASRRWFSVSVIGWQKQIEN